MHYVHQYTLPEESIGPGLQGYEGWWVSRSMAREQVHKVIGDTGMMDYMLKAIANRTVGPWAVFRLPSCRPLHNISESPGRFTRMPL